MYVYGHYIGINSHLFDTKWHQWDAIIWSHSGVNWYILVNAQLCSSTISYIHVHY